MKNIKKKHIIGIWNEKFSTSLEDKISLEMDGRVNYRKDGKYFELATMSYVFEHDMSQYNTKNLTFKEKNLVIASFFFIEIGTWSIKKNKIIQKINSSTIKKFNPINHLEIKSMPIDKESLDYIASITMNLYKKRKKSILKIKKISKKKIIYTVDGYKAKYYRSSK